MAKNSGQRAWSGHSCCRKPLFGEGCGLPSPPRRASCLTFSSPWPGRSSKKPVLFLRRQKLTPLVRNPKKRRRDWNEITCFSATLPSARPGGGQTRHKRGVCGQECRHRAATGHRPLTAETRARQGTAPRVLPPVLTVSRGKGTITGGYGPLANSPPWRGAAILRQLRLTSARPAGRAHWGSAEAI